MNPCRLRSVLISLVVVVAIAGASVPASAQTAGGSAPTSTAISADFKGAIGMGLLGAELGLVIPAAFGMRGLWPYIVFPVAGGAGGAVAGYYLLEEGAGNPEASVAVLVTGLTLLVPALIFTVARTAYRPDQELPPETALSLMEPEQRAALEAGPGLFRLDEEHLYVRPPGVAVAQNVSAKEALRTGTERHSEVRVPMVSGRF